ncbi:TELO2-interacting protein 1 -like protein [Halotydeus destructor]|nr:TELO2-interacting protein 1 -like protein [Halotydeus destructor]
MNPNDTFLLVRQLCLECTNQPNVHCLRRLKQVLAECDEAFLAPIQKYIALPLQLILNQYAKIPDNREAIVMETCSCLQLLFGKSGVSSFETFAEIYLRLFCLSDRRMPIETQPMASEDLKYTAMETALYLIKHSKLTVIKEALDCVEFRQAFGHSISVMLDLATNEPYKALKTMSMQALLCLLIRCEKLTSQSEMPRDVMASFLPGISISTLRIVTSDDKLPQKLICVTLECLEKICCLCLKSLKESKGQEKANLAQQRNGAWAEETSLKLTTAFKRFIPRLISHSSPLVQLALLKFAENTLTGCCEEYVLASHDVLLEIPLVLLHQGGRRTEAERSLSQISKKLLNDDMKVKFQDALLEKCYLTVSQMPREFRMLSDDEKLVKVNLLTGLFKLLGTEGLSSFASLTAHKERLLLTLVDVTEMKPLEPLAVLTDENRLETLQLRFPKKFALFERADILESIETLCRTISTGLNELLFCDILGEQILASRSESNILVCNMLVKHVGSARARHVMLENYVDLLLSDDLSIESDTLKLCLLLEGILFATSNSADSLKVSCHVVRVIYKMLHFASCSNLILREVSRDSLLGISNNLEYASLTDLLESKVDEVSAIAEANLDHYVDNTETPIVIKSLLELSDGKVLSRLEALIDKSLQALDIHYNQELSPFLFLLQTAVLSCLKFVPKEAEAEENENRGNVIEIYKRDLETFLRRRKEEEASRNDLSEVAENLDDGDTNEEQEEDDLDADKAKLPFYALITKKILERCIHLMADPEAETRIKVMDMVENGLVVMSPFENELLPLAHRLWAPLTKRFQDEVAVMRKAFVSLLRLSQVCGDFLRQRTQAEVLPKVLYFLRKQAKESHSCRHGYRFTLNYQVQLESLEGMAVLCRRLDVRGKHLWPVILVTIEHLSSKQPQVFQQVAQTGLRQLWRIEPETVYFYATMFLKSAKNRTEFNLLDKLLKQNFGEEI